MGFDLHRKPKRRAMPRSQTENIILNGQNAVDPVIVACGRTTDVILQEVFADSLANMLYTRRWLIEQREKELPGYRDEVNRQRSFVDLLPL